MKCPYVTNPELIDRTFNEEINYKDLGGKEDYVFFDHDDGGGNITRVQFCDLIGRKKDVFECFNENEWKNCFAYKSGAKNKMREATNVP